MKRLEKPIHLCKLNVPKNDNDIAPIVLLSLPVQTGLIKSCRESRYSMRDVEIMMLDFVKEHTSQGSCPLAGNSIYCDKMFLMKYMPEFTSYLHYRIVDVSSIKELCRFVDIKLRYYTLVRRAQSNRALFYS